MGEEWVGGWAGRVGGRVGGLIGGMGVQGVCNGGWGVQHPGAARAIKRQKA